MAGHVGKRRHHEHKTQRPKKKQRRVQQEYHSDSESEHDGENGKEAGAEDQEQAFSAVNLLDSDDDIHNAPVDDGAPEVEEDASSDSDGGGATRKKEKKKTASLRQKPSKSRSKKQTADSDQEDEDGDEYGESELDEEEEDEEEGENEDVNMESSEKKPRSKRNDPTAFATSLSKILSTKLSTSKRSDPVLSRSTAALEASKAAVDNALETKAKRKLKEQKRVAMEKGRVRDVLVPATHDDDAASGEPEMTTAEVLEMERKLRKIAQKGVVRLFNAVRAAQVKAAEAEKATRKTGVIGVKNREEKVNELSKKGFLELIASGGGGLKKGPLEEA